MKQIYKLDLIPKQYGRQNSTSAEEVVRFQRILPYKSELVDVRKDTRSPKSRSNIPRDRQLTTLW